MFLSVCLYVCPAILACMSEKSDVQRHVIFCNVTCGGGSTVFLWRQFNMCTLFFLWMISCFYVIGRNKEWIRWRYVWWSSLGGGTCQRGWSLLSLIALFLNAGISALPWIFAIKIGCMAYIDILNMYRYVSWQFMVAVWANDNGIALLHINVSFNFLSSPVNIEIDDHAQDYHLGM